MGSQVVAWEAAQGAAYQYVVVPGEQGALALEEERLALVPPRTERASLEGPVEEVPTRTEKA